MDVNIESILKKVNILGGHCPECNGFLYAEMVSISPLLIQNRCLKCGQTTDITENILRLSKTNKSFDQKNIVYTGSPYPTILSVKNDFAHKIDSIDDSTNNFINWYLKMIVEVK